MSALSFWRAWWKTHPLFQKKRRAARNPALPATAKKSPLRTDAVAPLAADVKAPPPETPPQQFYAREVLEQPAPLSGVVLFDEQHIEAALARGGLQRPENVPLEAWLESRCE